MTEEQMLTLDEAANLLEVSRVRVWQLQKSGDLVAIKRGGVWFVYPASLRSLIERRAAKREKKA